MLDGRPASEVAREHGVSRQTFHHRLKSGWSVRDAATLPVLKPTPRPKPEPKGPPIKHTLDGRPAAEVARENGVEGSAFYSRLHIGWTMEEAVNTPTDARVHHVLDGRAAVEVAREHGITPETFRSRVNLLGGT